MRADSHHSSSLGNPDGEHAPVLPTTYHSGSRVQPTRALVVPVINLCLFCPISMDLINVLEPLAGIEFEFAKAVVGRRIMAKVCNAWATIMKWAYKSEESTASTGRGLNETRDATRCPSLQFQRPPIQPEEGACLACHWLLMRLQLLQRISLAASQ